jgi:hypothetical protein
MAIMAALLENVSSMRYLFHVTMELPQGITETHRRRLKWFDEHKAEILSLVEMSIDGMRLAIMPKGIYKPADLDHALSIRIRLHSEYDDGGVVSSSSGGWTLRYFQEGHDPAARDRRSGNRGLMNCIQDRVPVGVVREASTGERQTKYEVLGLATVMGWSDGYFELEGFLLPNSPSDQEAVAQAEFDEQSAADPPCDDYDARQRAVRQIVSRRGQSDFRRALIEAYRGRCAITDCDAVAALEAAHLRPYRGPESNIVSNGLLLRADIHTLLDLGLLAVDPDSRTVAISKRLAGTWYEEICGKRLTDPMVASQRPTRATFDVMWHNFQETEEHP